MHEKFLMKAYTFASRSPMKRFGVGAVIVKNDKIVATGWCHPSDLNLEEYISIHAEVHAIYRAYPKDLKGSIIYIVARARKSKNRTIGKPCSQCAAFLYDAGVNKIVYSIDNNKYEVWNVGDEPMTCVPGKRVENW